MFWTSINSNIKLKGSWGVMADIHARRKNFIFKNSFDLIRVGVTYQATPKIMMAGGYARLWLAPNTAGWGTYSKENRLFAQIQQSVPINKITMLHRFRLEGRQQQKIVNDAFINAYRYTLRYRYLLSFNIPVFENKKLPSLALADELLLHSGKDVVLNVVDQNRIFIGVKQSLSKNWSFDVGYMRVLQQKFSGYQYDLNHTFRLFFYYTPDFRKVKSPALH